MCCNGVVIYTDNLRNKYMFLLRACSCNEHGTLFTVDRTTVFTNNWTETIKINQGHNVPVVIKWLGSHVGDLASRCGLCGKIVMYLAEDHDPLGTSWSPTHI